MTRIPNTDLDVFGLCLGGNVFGWTADEDASFSVLDAYVEAGGNFIDTADIYLPPNPGSSETIIGRWMASRGNRDEIVLATKVGADGGTSRANILPRTEGSLERLQTDRIDLYYTHFDDEDVPVEETLATYGELVDAGKVRHIAASNMSPARLTESLEVAEREGLPRYVALQPHYNLVEREGYERDYAPLAAEHDLAVFPYFALAKGFLTGKYRSGGDAVDSPRAEGATAYLDERGEAVLAALDEIAADRDATVAAVALAWLRSKPNVLAPIASARNTDQLAGIIASATLELTDDDVQALDGASA